MIDAEGDLLPGLIVDRYGDWLVAQLLDQGMDRQSGDVVGALTKLLSPKGIVGRNDVAVRLKENLPLTTGMLAGETPERVEIQMNGLRLYADLLGGQKTGIFSDQRENYLAARRYKRPRVGLFHRHRRLCAASGRDCDSVEAVDSSAAALKAGEANAAVNSLANITWREANVLDYLPSLVSARRTFDLVSHRSACISKSRSAMEGAVRGYKEINPRALRRLERGGILVSCSCSHHMSEAELLQVIAEAALDCGKHLRILERRTQSQDHPILLTVPETHYLKCLFFEVL